MARIVLVDPASKRFGFTIVETLIVLAVTSVLLMSAIILVSGRANKTQFTTAVYSFQQQLQQVINETTKGYYPNQGNFSCNATTPVSFGAAGTGLGTNGGCIFLGKILEFSASSPDSYIATPIAGNQYTGNSDTTSLAGAHPVIVRPLSQTVQLGGVSFVKAFTDGNPVNTVSGLGIFAGDANGSFATASSPGLASGTEGFSLWAISNRGSLVLRDTSPLYANDTNLTSLSICVAGGANQSALLTLGASGGLDVTTKIMSGSTCS